MRETETQVLRVAPDLIEFFLYFLLPISTAIDYAIHVANVTAKNMLKYFTRSQYNEVGWKSYQQI